MKLRVQGNAIRFRLNRREVEEFSATGRAGAAVDFGGGANLRYTLQADASNSVRAAFDGSEVLVHVPRESAVEWAAGEAVGLRGRQPLDAGGELEIVIEKDFQCMHNGDEAKDPDAYPNPMAAT
jgi:hypothetical protein